MSTVTRSWKCEHCGQPVGRFTIGAATRDLLWCHIDPNVKCRGLRIMNPIVVIGGPGIAPPDRVEILTYERAELLTQLEAADAAKRQLVNALLDLYDRLLICNVSICRDRVDEIEDLIATYHPS